MEPTVRNPRIESAIGSDAARSLHLSRRFSRRWLVSCRPKFSRGERNFWMQRPEAKNPPERPLLSAETGNSKIGVKNTRRNGLFSIDDGFRSSGRLDGGDDLDQTACSPRSHRTSLRTSSQERNFLLQRPGGETGSFGSIAGAETAPTREFGRHVFEIAALLRVPQRLHNYGVWVVEVVGHKLATHHPVIEPVSTAEPGTEIRDAETGTQEPGYYLA